MAFFARTKLLGVLVLLALALPMSAAAQAAGSVTGTVTANNLRPLAGAQVYIPGSGLGGLTNAQGRFLIPNVPAGQHQLRIEMLGYSTLSQNVTVQAGQTLNLSFQLEQTALAINEIVVTGVAAATPKAELPFTVEHLDFSKNLNVVPPTPGAMLQGRIAGTTVIQGSGQPGEDADIVLRAPTSISGGQSPLLIIDGVITSSKLSDINPQDIANIEVVKGAAAASLYGSRAQAGVINITTKRGGGLEDVTHYIMRTEYKNNDLPRPMERSHHHYYKMTADGKNFADVNGKPVTTSSARILDDGGNGSNANKAFAVNEFPAPGFIDPIKQFFSPGSSTSVYAAVEGRHGPMNYRLSASQAREGGIIAYDDGSKTQTFRLNMDQTLRSDLNVSFSGYYATVQQDLIGQGAGGILQSLVTQEPRYNLLELDADGDLKPVVGAPGEAINNILFDLKHQEDTRRRDRMTGGLQAKYTPFSWLSVEGNFSYDRSNVEERHYLAKGTKRAESGTGNLLEPELGRLSRNADLVKEMNRSLTVSVNRTFGDYTSRTQLRYLAERRTEDFWSAGGSQFAVQGVPRLGLLTGSTNIDSNQQKTASEGFFAITSLGYKSKYLVDVLVRRDGSSLFGSNERWQTYYRYSAAWRMAEESFWPFSFITEFKPRYSLGTAGGRPRFEAQYQTYAVDRGQISPRILGNADLRPELATEKELGIDAVIANRVTLNANYVRSTVDDQLLLVPLAGYYGFTSQWRNAGTLKSKSWEASLESALIQRPDFVWTSFVNYSRTRQIISKLGVPSYQIRYYRSTMYVVEGEPLGVFYGKKWARKCEDLKGIDCADFDVNDEGYLVYVGKGNTWKDGISKKLWGTVGSSNGINFAWGIPQAALPWPQVVKMGQSMPDWSGSWGNNVTLFGKLGINTLLQGEFGPEIYSGSLQWEDNSAQSGIVHDQAIKSEETRKPLGYYFNFYDVNINNDRWVRDGTYVKLREVSLHYTFSRDDMGRVFGRLSPQSATLNLTGRNLYTWTHYEGYDPEVGSQSFLGSAVVGRVDEQNYPNYRSIGIDVELSF